MLIGPPIHEMQLFEKLTLKGQGHGWRQSSKSQFESSILLTHIPFVPCQSALPFLRSIFKIWPWKSRVKVMGEVTVQSHNVGLTSYRLTSLSFHVNRPSHSSDTGFSKFNLEIQRSRSWVRSHLNSQWGSSILSIHIPFVPCQSGIPFMSYEFLNIWPSKSEVKVIGEVTVQSHNVGLASYQLTFLPFDVNRPFHS